MSTAPMNKNGDLCELLLVAHILEGVEREVGRTEEKLREESENMRAEGKIDASYEAIAFAGKLKAIAGKFESLRGQWEALKANIGNDSAVIQDVFQSAAKTWEAFAQPEKKSELVVTFPPFGEWERVIHHSKSIDTFAEAIELLGPEMVAALDITCNGTPLVTCNPDLIELQDKSIKPLCGGWYLSIHADTKRLASILKRISRELDAGIKVEVISGL